MATVGLSFGSATSGTGFDVASTVTSILAIESAIETPWKAQLESLQAQDSALTALGTNLASLGTALDSLTNFDGVLAQKLGSSSDTNVLTLTAAGATAVAGSHTVQVSSLAATSSNYSGVVQPADTLTGSLSLRVGSGGSSTVTIPDGGETMTALAQQINSGGYGLTASVVSGTSGSRLSIVSATSGAGGQITLSASIANGNASVGFQTGTDGADAQLTVDGLATTSASNTVTGAIPGVTFQLLQSSPGTTVQVQITNDTGAVEASVQSLVSAYNAVNTGLRTQEGKDATGKAEPLYGSPTLALLQSQLTSALNGGSGSGAIGNLAQLGLTVNQDGSLALEVSALGAALNGHFGDVTGFLQNAGGFGQTLTSALNALSSTGTTGGLFLALKENANKETAINSDISTEETRVAADKTKLTKELNRANQILQSIPSQLSQVDEIYSAVTGYNTKG